LLVSGGHLDSAGAPGGYGRPELGLQRFSSGTPVHSGNNGLGPASGAKHPQRPGHAIRSSRGARGRDLGLRHLGLEGEGDRLTRQRLASAVQDADLQ
jgi:hypothetical protein